MDTGGTRESDCVFQTFNPFPIHLTRYNPSLASHKCGKVNSFVSWSGTCIKNLNKENNKNKIKIGLEEF